MPPANLCILNFGASLVRGHTDYGLRATPYATWMKERLEARWPGTELDVVVDGVSGDMVTGTPGFRGRIGRLCK